MQDQGSIVLEERKIGFPGYKNFVPYYTNSSWNAAGDAFYFFSVKHGSRIPTLCIYHVDTDTTEKLLDLTLFNSAEEASYLTTSVILPHRGMLIFPAADKTIAAADINTGKQEIKLSNNAGDDWKFQVSLCISPDERYLCCSTAPEGQRSTDIRIYDTSAPRWSLVYHKTVDMEADHFQFFPNGDEILFAHEGPTKSIPDRLNLLNWKTGETRCLHHHKFDDRGNQIECIGHEHIAGDQVLAVRYPDSQMEFGIILVDPRTGKCELVDTGDYWHAASNKDGTRFVMDTMWWGNSRRRIPNLVDVTLFDAVNKSRYVLKTFPAEPGNNQIYHVHPHFNGNGDSVLYTVRPPGENECHLELLRIR